MPVEASEEDRVQDVRRKRVLVRPEHMVELVRIFLPHMAERDPGEARRRVRIEAERLIGRPAKYRIRMLAASNGSAVGICARITPYWSFSSSSAAGTRLKLAAMGVINVPQKPASMPTAPTTAGSPP